MSESKGRLIAGWLERDGEYAGYYHYGDPGPGPVSGGPAPVCPGCGSPDVDVRRGLLCGTCAEAAAGEGDDGE